MPTLMGVDIETYSSAPLPKCGVYRYCDAPDFGILLFSYAFDDDPVKTIDLASGETLPKEVISALKDPTIIKVAYNAQFERVCLSRYLGHWLDPHQWRCTMVMAAYLTLPGRLADAAVALGTTEKKMEEGKDLIRYFSVPCKPKNGEKLFLTPEEEKQAEMEQTAALESDVREGMIAEYLNTLLPEDWDKMDLAERRGFLRGDQFTGGNRTGTIQRTTVCAVEVWAECFGKDPSTIKRSDTYDIFGMLMKIGGWEKYSGNRNASLKRAPYGTQRCFVRVNALPDGCASENAG